MSDQRGPAGGPMAPDDGGKTAGSNTQSQGGISREVAQAARGQFDPAAGVPGQRPARARLRYRDVTPRMSCR